MATYLIGVPPVVDVSRASIGLYWDAAGILQTAAVDVGRIEYESGVLIGLLIEGPRTNLALHSEAMENAVWDGGGDVGLVTVNQTKTPRQE